jgi:GNAT superfamily N-acetyltransferase
MTLRPVRFEELPQVLRLVQRSVAFGCRDHYTARQRDAVFATYARALFGEALGPFEGVVAEDAEGDRLLGFAQLDPRGGRLRALFVDADAQGRGVGRALLADVEARAATHGCRRLHGAMSLNAAPFYAAAGFRALGGPEPLTAADPDGGSHVDVPIVRMEKRLPQPALRADSGLWSARSSL